MNQFLKKTSVLLIACNLSASLLASERPNIIWLMAEDISTDIGCYGMAAVKTPVIDGLAERGIRFTNAFVTNPICSPARSAMITGVFQSKIHAQHHRSNRRMPLQEPYVPFTKLLRDHGYTCILGSKFVMDNGRKIDVNFRSQALGPWDGIDRFGLFDKLDNISVDDQPFFAQIQLKVTHRGDWWNDIRERSASPVDPEKVELPPYMADHPVIREDWAKYLDQIEYMDTEIETIIQDLKDKGIYDNTVIIFIGDNGRCNIRGKGYLFDPGLRIPFIISWPAGIDGGEVREDLVSSIDITASILDLAGVTIPEWMDGQSVFGKDFSRDYVYASRDLWDEVMEQSRSIITSRYKYIRNDMYYKPYDAGQAYPEFYRPAVHIMRKLKWENKLTQGQRYFFDSNKPEEELYDLLADPHEMNNLASDPNLQDILAQLRNTLAVAEKEASPEKEIFYPETPESVNILEWVRYMHRDKYLEMLEGVEIGFQRLRRLFKEQYDH